MLEILTEFNEYLRKEKKEEIKEEEFLEVLSLFEREEFLSFLYSLI